MSGSLPPFCPIVGREGKDYHPRLSIEEVQSRTHPRLSIEDLQSEKPEQFTLFILSYLFIQERSDELAVTSGSQSKKVESVLNAFHEVSQSSFAKERSAMTFAELAGIHGLPYKEWLGDAKLDKDKKTDYDPEDRKDTDPSPSRFGGYCNHGSVLFPFWHRPYVMAIEQAIGDVADRIADCLEKTGMFSKELWAIAAKELRFPFWDWAEERVAVQGLPPVLSDREVILKFDGAEVKVSNPLAYFPFKSIPPGFKNIPASDTEGRTAYFKDWKRTFRHAPDNQDAWESSTEELNEQLKKKAQCLRFKVASLFSINPAKSGPETYQSFDKFSNHTAQSTKVVHYNEESLEGVHDSVHDIIGGNGHMADPDYAGFDPIFFLHHCNVDRLLALWEYVYPKECYIGNGKGFNFTQNNGTYTLVYNAQVLGNTELAPFRLGTGGYWTSDHARRLILDEETFHKFYTYPEVAGVKVDKALSDKQKEMYRGRLQKYYGLQQTYVIGDPKQFQIANDFTILQDSFRVVINIKMPEFAFSGPYSVEVNYKETFLGSVSVFARQSYSNCSNCMNKRDQNTVIHGIIPVPNSVIHDAQKTSRGLQNETAVLEVLDEIKKRLTATIVNGRGNEVAKVENVYNNGNDGRLDKVLTPTVTLAWSRVARRLSDGEEGPVYWKEWSGHGDVFEDQTGWATTTFR